VFLDQSTKAAALVYLLPSSPVSFLGDYCRFTLIRNRGAAFGVTLGPFSDTILVVISALAILFIILYYFRTPPASIWQHFSFGMITGGAAGNLIDRIAQGEVVDFIDMGIGQVRWPIFNVADIAVTVGAILLLSHSFSSRDGTTD